MVRAGRLPLNSAEHNAINKLIDQHPDDTVSFTRRDPDEQGPLLVHVGDDTYQLDGNGKRKKVN